MIKKKKEKKSNNIKKNPKYTLPPRIANPSLQRQALEREKSDKKAE